MTIFPSCSSTKVSLPIRLRSAGYKEYAKGAVPLLGSSGNLGASDWGRSRPFHPTPDEPRKPRKARTPAAPTRKLCSPPSPENVGGEGEKSLRSWVGFRAFRGFRGHSPRTRRVSRWRGLLPDGNVLPRQCRMSLIIPRKRSALPKTPEDLCATARR